MKLKSFLITLLSIFMFSPLAFAQKVDNTAAASLTDEQKKKDPTDVIIYSKAKMYVGYPKNADGTTNKTKATMLVEGSAKFGNGAEIDQKGETQLLGNFINSMSVKNANIPTNGVTPSVRNFYHLFVNLDNTQNGGGQITFKGLNNMQKILREPEGGLAPSDYPGNKNNYQMRFPGIKVDKKVYTGAFNNWANNPLDPFEVNKINITNVGYLAVDTSAAISVKYLDISDKNRFSVEVKQDVNDPHSKYYKLNSGYAAIGKLHDTADGSSQVDMQLYDFDKAKGIDLTGGNADPDFVRTNSKNGAIFLRGFTSPFKELAADYMYFQVLTKPDKWSVTGHKGPIADPKTKMIAGLGYFMAMDVSDVYMKKIYDKWFDKPTGQPSETYVNVWKQRARGGYNFSRRLFNELYSTNSYRKGFSMFSESEIDERFNDDDVTIVMDREGLNFLGNPYMTPISLKDILDPTDTGLGTSAPFSPQSIKLVGKNGDQGFVVTQKLASHTVPLIRSRYWLINHAFIKTTKWNGLLKYAYNVKYDVVATAGTASTVPNPREVLIEPMQMFAVQTSQELMKFTFVKSKVQSVDGYRFNTASSTALGSQNEPNLGPSTRVDKTEDNMKDWFILESRSNKRTNQIDRTSVRFFNTATLAYDLDHDEEKRIAGLNQEQVDKIKAARATYGVNEDEENIGESIGEVVVPQNVIYTKSSDGRALLANGIPYDTKEIPLYYLPGDEEEEIIISTYGTDRFEQVEGVWLIDHYLDASLKLEPGEEYKFISKPMDKDLAEKNRFTLRFADPDQDDNEGPQLKENPITCYYSGSILHITGLNEKDLGSSVKIFDLQGRLMGQTKIKDYPSNEYPKVLGLGTFIVKITGERNYTTKFVNLQNY